MRYNSFCPGQEWLDTEGKLIQAHGGSIFYENGLYYWYGENKDKNIGENELCSWGIRCYTSKDLYNWEDKGLIIKPDLEDELSPLHPNAVLDRPHIIYNKFTKKYVCWFKSKVNWQLSYSVMIADDILGPYTFAKTGIRPLDMTPGDFDLAVAEDGKAYIYFTRVWGEIICADLTSDYTDVSGYYSTHFHQTRPPFCREAPAHFTREYKHYIINSGTTGYFPNPSEIAVAKSWHGPYFVCGNPHPNDETNTSYHTQVSNVFKVEGKKDLYIACADRWVPDCMDIPYEFYRDYMTALFASKYENMDEYIKELAECSARKSGKSIDEELGYYIDLKKRYDKPYTAFNTSVSRYVWLPIRFEIDENTGCEHAIIDWKDEWKIEDYE